MSRHLVWISPQNIAEERTWVHEGYLLWDSKKCELERRKEEKTQEEEKGKEHARKSRRGSTLTRFLL